MQSYPPIQAPLSNISPVDPTAFADSSAGYAVGSLWLNASAKILWTCIDATIGAAVWASSLLADGSVSSPGLAFAADRDTGARRKGANVYVLVAGGVDRLEINGAGATTAIADSASAIALDVVGRSADDTSYQRFLNAARTVQFGSIASYAGGGLQLSATGGMVLSAGAGQSHLTYVGSTLAHATSATAFNPGADNGPTIGSAGARWATVFAVTASINTSDARLKTVRGALTSDELAAAKEIAASIVIYQFNDSIAEKGLDAARLHAGVIAQNPADAGGDDGAFVASIMRRHNLDPDRYAFFCYDTWEAQAAIPAIPPRAAYTDEDTRDLIPEDPGHPSIPARDAIAAGDRYGIRYEELAMFLAAAQEQRLLAVEAYMAAHP